MRPILTDVVANERLRSRLGDELLAGKLSHAYILSGERGIGKHTLALNLAAALACERGEDASLPLPCLTCSACRKILEGNSPDVIYVNRGDKATLGVDPIRELRQDVYIPPNEKYAGITIIINTIPIIIIIGKSSFVPASSPSFLAVCFRSSNAFFVSVERLSFNPSVPRFTFWIIIAASFL